jgi:hypothetical protein
MPFDNGEPNVTLFCHFMTPKIKWGKTAGSRHPGIMIAEVEFCSFSQIPLYGGDA